MIKSYPIFQIKSKLSHKKKSETRFPLYDCCGRLCEILLLGVHYEAKYCSSKNESETNTCIKICPFI